jgi:hypothetical protein
MRELFRAEADNVTDGLFQSYSINYGKEGASLSDSDADCHVIIRNLTRFCY